MKRITAASLILCLLAPAAMAAGNAAPRVYPISQFNSIEVLSIDRPTTIHLPASAEVLVVEEYQPKTDYLEEEVRAYNYQQTGYWLAAGVIMVYIWLHR
ncbi:MAG TPA: hypothetical protein VMD02_03795 [Candidatus Omnitrophota bacterium]|nr:hypothetical protein [Candidatus Omnitrophota bacterium]